MSLQVLYIYVVLAVQDILCVWFHVAGVRDNDGGDHVCDCCLYILPHQWRGL